MDLAPNRPASAEDEAAAVLAALAPGWRVLGRLCGGCHVLAHPARGVALVDVAPGASPGAEAKLRRALAAHGLDRQGHLPMAHVRVSAGGLSLVQPLLEGSFGAQPALGMDSPIWEEALTETLAAQAGWAELPFAAPAADAPTRSWRRPLRWGLAGAALVATFLGGVLLGLTVADDLAPRSAGPAPMADGWASPGPALPAGDLRPVPAPAPAAAADLRQAPAAGAESQPAPVAAAARVPPSPAPVADEQVSAPVAAETDMQQGPASVADAQAPAPVAAETEPQHVPAPAATTTEQRTSVPPAVTTDLQPPSTSAAAATEAPSFQPPLREMIADAPLPDPAPPRPRQVSVRRSLAIDPGCAQAVLRYQQGGPLSGAEMEYVRNGCRSVVRR